MLASELNYQSKTQKLPGEFSNSINKPYDIDKTRQFISGLRKALRLPENTPIGLQLNEDSGLAVLDTDGEMTKNSGQPNRSK